MAKLTREEALLKIGELVAYARIQGWDDVYTDAFKLLKQETRKKGKWEFIGYNCIGDSCFRCSECGEFYTLNYIKKYCNNRFPKECPNCTIEMEV